MQTTILRRTSSPNSKSVRRRGEVRLFCGPVDPLQTGCSVDIGSQENEVNYHVDNLKTKHVNTNTYLSSSMAMKGHGIRRTITVIVQTTIARVQQTNVKQTNLEKDAIFPTRCSHGFSEVLGAVVMREVSCGGDGTITSFGGIHVVT
jgi:hypothetical protein